MEKDIGFLLVSFFLPSFKTPPTEQPILSIANRKSNST
jgi:hypothetical protein